MPVTDRSLDERPRYRVDAETRTVLALRDCVNPAMMSHPLDADVDTFEPLGGPYARDGSRVFYNDGGEEARVLGDDPRSFEVLSHGYARDQRRAFLRGRAISERGASFVVLSELLAKDDACVYCEGRPFPSVHAATFALAGGRYARDRARVYWIDRERQAPFEVGLHPFPESDAATFEAREGGAAGLDRAHFYFGAIAAPRSDHDVFAPTPAGTRLDALSRSSLIAMAVRKLHGSAASQPETSPVRRSFFDPRRFERVRALTQPTGSLVVIFDQPVRFIPKDGAFVYARTAALHVVKHASGPFGVRANPEGRAAITEEEFEADPEAAALAARVLAALGLRREEVKGADIVELYDGEAEVKVVVRRVGRGEEHRFDKRTGAIARIGDARGTEYPHEGCVEVGDESGVTGS